MSMNKTCPISNFTSEEDSEGIRVRFYLKSRDSTSRFSQRRLNRRVLVVNRKLRVADDVDKQDVPNLELHIGRGLQTARDFFLPESKQVVMKITDHANRDPQLMAASMSSGTRNESATHFSRLRNLSVLRFGCTNTLLEQLNNHTPCAGLASLIGKQLSYRRSANSLGI